MSRVRRHQRENPAVQCGDKYGARRGAYFVATSSGTVDVHAGNPKLITASHLALQAGDSVSFTGENVTVGDKSVFVARIIQKGNQSVAVRSANGTPLRPTARSADGHMILPGGIR